MMPEKRILEEVKKGLIKDIESMTDAIKEIGNLSVKSTDLMAVEKNLMETLGTKVVIKGNDNRGKIEISYFSLDDLNRILEIIKQ